MLATAVLIACGLVGSVVWESLVEGRTQWSAAPLTPIDTPVALPPNVQASVVTATFETILGARSVQTAVYRLRENPRIIVVDFATLAEQGQMMNRLAALIEKTGAPRDRVLAEGELTALIQAEGSSAATFYIGHDYAAPALARFYSLASFERQSLNEAEVRLRDLLLALGVIVARGAEGYAPGEPQVAVVTTVQLQRDDPATPQNETIDASLRATILHHEVSHGEFFTNEAYRRYCEWFWRARLTGKERDLFRAMLSKSGYNEDDETLMINEMQAHLMHTPDPRAFSAGRLCVSEAQLAELRQRFMAGNPPTFLLGGAPQGN